MTTSKKTHSFSISVSVIFVLIMLIIYYHYKKPVVYDKMNLFKNPVTDSAMDKWDMKPKVVDGLCKNVVNHRQPSMTLVLLPDATTPEKDAFPPADNKPCISTQESSNCTLENTSPGETDSPAAQNTNNETTLAGISSWSLCPVQVTVGGVEVVCKAATDNSPSYRPPPMPVDEYLRQVRNIKAQVVVESK